MCKLGQERVDKKGQERLGTTIVATQTRAKDASDQVEKVGVVVIRSHNRGQCK